MDFKKININTSTELAIIENYNIDINNFENIKELIKLTLKKLRVSLEDLSIYYQRFDSATSVLAIKVMHGSDMDISNYMFVGCSRDSQSLCEISMHAEAKVGQVSLEIANAISKSIVSFFKKVEDDLVSKGLEKLSFSINMPLSEEKTPDKPSKVKQFLKSILKK